MHDDRFDRLAKLLVEYSIRLKRNETVLIEAFDIPDEMTIALIRAVRKAGGVPFAQTYYTRVNRALALEASDRQLNLMASHELTRMKKMNAYIAVRGSNNITELSDVPPEKMKLIGRKMRRVQDQRVKKTKWVVLRYPTPSMAQLAGMSTEQFETFFYDVCTLDYSRMADAIRPLADLMRATDHVRSTGPGTDLDFSIKGIGAVPCEGRRNLPDGECYSAPVRDSVEGTIAYNTPSLYLGTTYQNVRFRFEGGKIVEATGEPQDRLERLLDSDEGARHIGEFSLGFNPYVLHPMKDTL